MKVLIVGSKGFIGTHLINALSSKYDTWGCDVVTDYGSEQYIQIKITNADFNEIFNTHRFEVCINCSGAASVPASIEDPLNDFELNTVNVFRILDSIRKHNFGCKLINLSSAAVYGNPKKLPITENQTCTPVSPYGNHKYLTEQICAGYNNFYNLQVCSLRIFSAYGPGLKKQLLWDLFKKSKQTDNITLSGTGSETRDFIYIDDIIRCIELVMKHGEFNASVYNIANGSEIRVKQLTAMFLSALHYNGSFGFTGEQRLGDPLCWKADIEKIKALGYEQTINIETGISNYVTWLKEQKLV